MQSISDLFLGLIISSQLCSGNCLMTSSLWKKLCIYTCICIYYKLQKNYNIQFINNNKIYKLKFGTPIIVIYYYKIYVYYQQ